MDAANLYRDDIVLWAEQQAAALRKLAARPDLSNAVDWENIIEEVESLGRSEWKGVESQLRNALAHILKGFCDPGSLSLVAWSIETEKFLIEARSDYRRSMRQLIDLDRAWQTAFRLAASDLRGYIISIPPGIPTSCPFTLDEMIDETFTFDAGRSRLFALVGARRQHFGVKP